MRIPFLFLFGIGLFLGLTAFGDEVTNVDMNDLLDADQKVPALQEETKTAEVAPEVAPAVEAEKPQAVATRKGARKKTPARPPKRTKR
jgi:hypothetical protein